MRLWRICKAKYADEAFSGEGARRFAGRWNPPGVPMVYTSTSRALAAMEFFINLDPSVAPNDLVIAGANLPSGRGVSQRLSMAELPVDWRRPDHPALREIGKQWISSLDSLALYVPSAAVNGEWNVLLNPAHPMFQKVHMAETQRFSYDPRMFRQARLARNRAKRVQVESNTIASLAYDARHQQLDIEFRDSGLIFRYFEVPREEYIAFLNAESKGSYLNRTFKKRRYPYTAL